MNRLSYKWLLLAILSLAFFFNQTDRALFGLLTVPIQNDLGLDDIQVGAINTALFATIAIVTPFAGPLGDRFSHKWIITISLIGWSLMTILTGFTGSFISMVLIRSIAAGAGEACYMPSAVPLIARYHVRTRSIALSAHQGMLYIGLIAAGSMVGALYAAFGESWRALFVLFGALGLLLGISFIWMLKDAKGEREASAGEGIWAGVKVFFTCPSALLMTCGAAAVVAVNNAYLAWMPKFAAEKFSLSLGEAGSHTMAWHHVAAMAAIFVSGTVTDIFARSKPRFRIGLQIAALLAGAPAVVALGLAPSAAAVWAAAAAYGICRGFFEANTHASVFDVIAPQYRSTAVGMMAMCAFLAGSLSPLMVGCMAERSKCAADSAGVAGFSAAFAVLGAVYLIGAAALALAFFRTFRKDRISE